ncbi:uncharacterized protein LOC107037359 [Diachasma alloeum]|uniref:uncharacterized protein LOC107037359 n=1 Tax=Diachasma alloeum TaxID=454923 RepID=UPI00073812A6|nr:uncharacterized protein LOC107037359 [Diachasma alloeum]
MGDNNEINFTSNEEMDNLQAGDNTADITAGVVRLDPQRRCANAPPPKVELLRAILNNQGPDGGRNIRVLFWQDRAREFNGRILGKVIHIQRGRVVPSNPAFINHADNLISVELSIGASTMVDILGDLPQNVPDIPQPRVVASLRTLARYEDLIRVEGYIKVRIQQHALGNMSYGAGAITNGRYHLCLNVANFDIHVSPQVGAHVTVEGTPRRNRYNHRPPSAKNGRNKSDG